MIVTLYHGTSRAFGAFDATSIGRGGDANSSLGVHLCEDPELAWHYATIDGHPDAQVLIVEADIERAGLIDNSLDFFGVEDGEQVHDADDFALAAKRLAATGLCAVAVDDIAPEVSGTWVVFDPARLSIAGRLFTEQEAMNAPRVCDIEITLEAVSMFDDLTLSQDSASLSAARL